MVGSGGDLTAGSWEAEPGSALITGPTQLTATRAITLAPGETERLFRVVLLP